jgi:hypothetical protein
MVHLLLDMDNQRGIAKSRRALFDSEQNLIGRCALGAAGQQRPGVGEHHRVVVHVNDPGLRRDPLRHPVGVVRGRQAGAYVEELADPRLASQVSDDPDPQRTGKPGSRAYARVQLRDLFADLAVDLVVVLAAQPVVPDPGRMRYRGINLA